jgi:hypothetical protein
MGRKTPARSAGKAARCGPQSPRSLLDKLGVRDGMRVSLVGLGDPEFERQLAGRKTQVWRGVRAGSEMIFWRIGARADLVGLARLMRGLDSDGQIWALWPKGRPELREDDVRNAALPLGLVDTKVVSFSDTLSGLRLVIRKELRAAAGKGARRRP